MARRDSQQVSGFLDLSLPLSSALVANWRGDRSDASCQVAAAVRAELVAFVDGALALRADRGQAVAVTGAEPETRLDCGVALRTVRRARLAQNEIQHDAQRVGAQPGK